jgi:cytosine/adenosine deaminase-related metal-dependent hydrolase
VRAAAATAALLALAASAPALADGLYLEAGRLLDVETGQVLTGQCILIEGERILRVEPCAATPEGAVRIDWSACTVLPGLIDLHTHLADTGNQLVAAMPELGSLENKQAASRAGLAPVARRCGQWKGNSFIRGGRANVRQALYMPALVAARFNPDLKAK